MDTRLEAIAGPLVTLWRNGQPRQVIQVPAGATIITVTTTTTPDMYLWERPAPTRWFAIARPGGIIRINTAPQDRYSTGPAWVAAVNDVYSEWALGGRRYTTATAWNPADTAGILVTHATLTIPQAEQAAIWLAGHLAVPLPPRL